ncbi:MAG: GAF domain-containing protein [Anaerolineales bacterium]
MLDKLKEYISDPEDNDPAYIRLVRTVLIFSLVTTAVVMIITSGIFTGNINVLVFSTLAVTTFFEAVALYSIIRNNNVLMGKYIVPWALIIAITFLAANSNGIHDIAVIAYFVAILLAFLLQREKATALTIPLAALAFIILGALDIFGITKSPIAEKTGIDDIAFGVIITATSGFLLQLLTSRLSESLRRAKENELAQIEINKALRALQASLEQRVEERTAALTITIAQNEKRAKELEAIAEISRSIALVQDIEELLPRITQLISEKFGFYHVGIFLLDEKHEYAVLRAANSEGGQRMLKRQHKLRVESSSLVGFASLQKQPRIALDVGADAVFFNNPDLPETRSEIALPMMIGERVLGVLDVQSTEPNAFTPDDIQGLATLTAEVAVAIENARLFNEARTAAETAEKVYRQFLAQSWQRASSTAPHVGYRFTGNGLDALVKPLSTSEIKKAAEQGELVIVEEKKRSALAVPIKVRDQVIGVLNVRSQTQGRRWDEEELTLVRALADRVALALENARLLAEAQRRAAKERVIGQISDRISAASSIEGVLQTALQELGRTVKAANLSIQLTDPVESVEES